MSKRVRIIEWAKTALIVLLTVSALLLGWRTTLFNDFLAAIPIFGNVADLMRGTADEHEYDETTLTEAARPLIIVITDDSGERYGVRYDTDARNAVYNSVKGIFTEALSSAASASEISESEWREALSGAGVYFEYPKPVKLSFLDNWFGAYMQRLPEDKTLRRLFVAFVNEGYRFYFQDSMSNSFYRADTVLFSELVQEFSIFRPNGAVFAYETAIHGASSEPYMLIMPEGEHVKIYASHAGSTTDMLDIIMLVLGHGNETYTTLPDGTDAIRCVGTQFNIRLDQQGRAYYLRTDGLPEASEPNPFSEGEMVERARAIVAETIGEMCGDAEVFLEALEYNEAGHCLISFGYYIAGGNIHLLEEAYAARVTFMSGVIIRVELNFKSFTYTDEYTRLLPERQVLAAANGGFMLSYFDSGEDILLPEWVRVGNH
jgi:hypothetical protein